MQTERSLVLAKPDALQRGLVGELISRCERIGMKLVAIKMVRPTAPDADKHYNLTEEWGKAVFNKAKAGYEEQGKEFPYESWEEYSKFIKDGLIEYLQAGPIVAMVWEGVGAVKLIRKLVGKTDPYSSEPGTYRGDYAIDSFNMANEQNRPIRNLVHASGEVDEAKHEIGVWFTEEELHGFEHVLERIMYDPNALR